MLTTDDMKHYLESTSQNIQELKVSRPDLAKELDQKSDLLKIILCEIEHYEFPSRTIRDAFYFLDTKRSRYLAYELGILRSQIKSLIES